MMVSMGRAPTFGSFGHVYPDHGPGRQRPVRMRRPCSNPPRAAPHRNAPPVASLVAFAAVTGIAGVLAAIPPARRASRLDVLRALQYE
jgi:hypothetical protein